MSISSIAAEWSALAETLSRDPALLQHAVAGLIPPPGQTYGRYADGNLVASPPADATVDSLIAQSVANSAAVAISGAAVDRQAMLTAAGDTEDFTAAVVNLAETLRAAAADPADQVRLSMALANFYPVSLPANAPIGAALAAVEQATAAMCRRAALISLARATSVYQPNSYDDALDLAEEVLPLFDAEALFAADNNDDATYQAFLSLRAAVASDLQSRGQQIARLVTVSSNQPLPAPVWAYRLYQDATRMDDLIGRVDPPHPGLMPTSFEALAD